MQKFIYTFSDNHGKTFSKLGVEGIFLSIQQISYLLVKREECHEGQRKATMATSGTTLLWLLFSCCVMCDSVATPRTVAQSFFVHGIFLAKILEWVAIFSPGDLPNPGIESVSPALAGQFFTTELPGKLPLLC